MKRQIIKRGIAYIIDCTICFVLVMLIFQWGVLSNLRDSIGITDEWFKTVGTCSCMY